MHSLNAKSIFALVWRSTSRWHSTKFQHSLSRDLKDFVMDVFAVEKEDQKKFEELRLSLTAISQKAIGSNLNDLSQVLELAQIFEKWTLHASTLCGIWIEDYRIQAQQLVTDLQTGRPVPKCMENLLRALLQIHRTLDKEREQRPVPMETQITPAPVSVPELAPASLPEAVSEPVPTQSMEKFHEILQKTFQAKINNMESLLEALGELTLCQAQLSEDLHASALSESAGLNSEAVRLEKLTRQIRDLVLTLRMVPVQPLFQKITEQAQTLSRKMRKPVEIITEGEEFELDQLLIEDIEILLTHLLANTLEHGLESTAERQSLGKAPQGLFKLKASHMGGGPLFWRSRMTVGVFS